MPTFKIITLGCKVNQFESEVIARRLEALSWSPSSDFEAADLYIINSCSVTGRAAMQSRQAIRQAIRSRPDACIVVTGCYAQVAPQEIKKINGIHYLIANDLKYDIGDFIELSAPPPEIEQPLVLGSFSRRERDFKVPPELALGDRSRPLIKIQDGCDTFCTYCIVPYARGSSRSMPQRQVIETIKAVAAAGYHETVLTGIHLGMYGLDLAPPTRLTNLLREIVIGQVIDRVRLSSIEPHELDDSIINLMAESDRICRHLHIPLQSGDDQILARMQRPYRRELFYELITEVISRIPDAAIGVDILVGFPGENAAAFKQTLELIDMLPVAYLHVFPFSARPHTPASRFTDKIPPNIIKSRCARLRKLGHSKRMAFYQKLVGRTLQVIVEAPADPSAGTQKCLSSNYAPIYIRADKRLRHRLAAVTIEKLDSRGRLLGYVQHQQKKAV